MRRWREAFLPIVERILLPESRTPPLPPERRRALLERSPEGRLLLETSALSPLAFVEREFEHPVVRAGLLFFNGLREVDLRCAGFGHHIPMLLAAKGKAQMCRGGSAALARALVRAVEEAGGEVRLGTEPEAHPGGERPGGRASRPRTASSFGRGTSWPRASTRSRPSSSSWRRPTCPAPGASVPPPSATT